MPNAILTQHFRHSSLHSYRERRAGYLTPVLFAMSKSNRPQLARDSSQTAVEISILTENGQGVEVQNLQSYGIGIDCHSRFIAVCVHVRRDSRVFRYQHDFDTDWDSLIEAKNWAVRTIRENSNPIPDLDQPLHYVIEATSTYHMPVLLSWEGKPSVINPLLAGATKKKTDRLDAERLSFHDLTGVWRESYVPPGPVQSLRVLIAERNHFSRLATQCSNRINNILLRFGITVGRNKSVTKNTDVRLIVEDLISDSPHEHAGVCPHPLPAEVRSIIRQEYANYDENARRASEYLAKIRQQAYSIDWETGNGTIPGREAVRILCTAPGIGEITSFTWLASIGTPRRFPNAKALNAYSGLDPSLKVSAGKVTSTKKRGGCLMLHSLLVSSADRIIRSHSEAFGRWGYLMAKSSGKWKKANTAVGRKLNTALYHMILTGSEFSYENYSLINDAVELDIPVAKLPSINPDFKRYVKVLHENGIMTTSDLVASYLSCSLGRVRGLRRKFFVTLQNFVTNQNKY